MADQEQLSLASTFPNPPPFWKDFTPDKVEQIEELRTAYVDKNGGEPETELEPLTLRVPDVPEHLVNLQPPPEPADGRWRVFGDQYMVRIEKSCRA